MERKFDGADGIRGVACLLVLLGHGSAFFAKELLPYVGFLAKAGVWLFFVLSAFLLTRKFMSTGFSICSIAKYGAGRFLRILPLFYIAGFAFYGFGESPVDSLLLRNGYAHLWTIPVEFKFYYVLPIFAYIFTVAYNKAGVAGSSALLVLMMVAVEYKYPYWNTPENSMTTIWYLPCFLLGCYIASVYDSVSKQLTDRRRLICAGVVVSFFVMMSPPARLAVFDMPMDGWTRTKFIYMSIAWSVFIIALVDGRGPIGKLFDNVVMRKIGLWSFSIYLFHWVVYAHMLPYCAESKLGMIASIIAAIAGGAASYYLIEKHIEWFRHYLLGSSRMRTTPHPTAS
jgi:peptidoglycan/LPS O-acetylase OafA/YrhL